MIKNNLKKILSITFVFTLFFAYFAFTKVVDADVIKYGNTKDDNCLTFDINDNGYPVAGITVNGNYWAHDDNDYVFYTPDADYTIVILAGKKGDSFPRVSTAGGFDAYGKIDSRPNVNQDENVVGDEYIFTITLKNYPYNGQNGSCSGFGISLEDGPNIEMPQKDLTAKLNVTINGTDLEWHEPSDEASHFTFGINDSPMIFLKSDNLNFTREDGKIISGSTIVAEDLPYRHDESETVTFNFHTNTSEYINKIIINDHEYQTPKTREELTAAYDREGLCISFDITGVPYEDTYTIIIDAVRLTGDNQLTGGFGWNYSTHGDLDATTDRIPNGEIHFVNAIYNGVQYDTVSEMKLAGNLFEWVDAIRKETYEIGDRDCFGYAYFPVGTVVTIKIVPYQGYQLVGLKEEHRNVTRLEEPGYYRFEIHGGGAALGVVFSQVDNEVRTSSNKVLSGTIDTDQQVQMGSIKLEVSEANVSDANKTKFENALEEGFEINNYLDLSLYNTVYKGVMDENNEYFLSWDSPLNNLQKDATITLRLDDDMKDKDIVVVHEKNNGNGYDYELINVNYDEEHNAITFDTDSFSNYAIAVKNTNQNVEPGLDEPGQGEDPPQEVIYHPVTFDSRGGSEVEEAQVPDGDMAPRPEDPTKEGLIFGGWYMEEECENEYDFEHGAINGPTTLFARWVQNYTVTDEQGNTIEFNNEPNTKYNLRIFDYTAYSKEEIMDMFGATSEQYDAFLNPIKNAVEGKGTFLSLLEIDLLVDENGNGSVDDGEEHYIEEGPLKIRIKMTDEMKKYDSFKIAYVDGNQTLQEVLDLTVDGDFLVGTLNHLSTYVVIGNNNPVNPSTSDNINQYITLLGLSLIGLLGVGLYTRKRLCK